jgi:hypothetical protein
MRVRIGFLYSAFLTFTAQPAPAQDAPSGLAAAAIANPNFRWIRRAAPGYRVYFLADSYPARHQDSLLRRLPEALAHARRILQVDSTPAPIDLFFIETRPQMEDLIGGRATGFAQPLAHAVFLVTNPEWRAFERHEVMHVVAVDGWGQIAPGNDWLQEGLAQFADGRCGAYANGDVALALSRRHGWIPFDDVVTRFRSLPDLRGYLQAAAFVQYLHERFGAAALQPLWSDTTSRETRIAGQPLFDVERQWRSTLRATRQVSDESLSRIEQKGCG